MNVGTDVMIWGGISHCEHGRIERIMSDTAEPFAVVTLRRKDGKLSKNNKTLVPLRRCHELPDYVIKMQEEEKRAWMKRWGKELWQA